MDNRIKTASGLNVLAGIWLFFSPWIFNYAVNYGALWSSVIVGVIVVALAAMRAFNPENAPAMSWFNFLLGLWVIASPWIFGYALNTSAMWDKVITGAIVSCLAAISASAGTPATPTSHPISARH